MRQTSADLRQRRRWAQRTRTWLLSRTAHEAPLEHLSGPSTHSQGSVSALPRLQRTPSPMRRHLRQTAFEEWRTWGSEVSPQSG